MNGQLKHWSAMTGKELAVATRQFDDPDYDPPARRPPKAELAKLRRVQKLSKKARLRVAVALEGELIDQTDQYAASHGVTFSDVVSDALRRLIRRKSA